MEGQGIIETQDKVVDDRFLVLQALNCDSLDDTARIKGRWRKAIPPLSQYNSGLSPADHFGKTKVEKFSDDIRVGVINVEIGR